MLSDQDKATLRERYAGRSLDEVKVDLKRPFRWVYGSPDRDQFATDWVHETEDRARHKLRRRRKTLGFDLIALTAQIGVIIGSKLFPTLV